LGICVPIATVLAWVLIVTAPAQATVVTVGSPLTAAFSSISIGGSVAYTSANSALPEAGAHATSPVTGTVVTWRISGATGGPFKLRVLHPAGGGAYTGAGTSAPVTPSSMATLTFTTSLPIQAGDLIALDDNASFDQIGTASVPGATLIGITPPLADGATAPPSATVNNTEFAFNAEVATVPSNADTLGKVKLNKHNGTATLSVNVPGPGTLLLTGKNVKAQRSARAAMASKTVTAAGKVKLLVKAKGKAKTRLNKTGKAKVKVKVTYTPTGDLPGIPNTQTKRVKLIKKH
jgi:hypothetical protein